MCTALIQDDLGSAPALAFHTINMHRCAQCSSDALFQPTGLYFRVQDAYNAIQANPSAHGALGNLQRLVNTMPVTTLCRLPYAADHNVQAPDGRQAACLMPALHVPLCTIHGISDWPMCCSKAFLGGPRMAFVWVLQSVHRPQSSTSLTAQRDCTGLETAASGIGAGEAQAGQRRTNLAQKTQVRPLIMGDDIRPACSAACGKTLPGLQSPAPVPELQSPAPIAQQSPLVGRNPL